MFYWKVCYYWSVSNNIHPIDNVGKIILNFQSVRDIFRNYERSYYFWVLRYVYFPLGGKFTKWFNLILIIQLYIMLNEMDKELFYWGLEMAAIFIVEELIYMKWNQVIFKLKYFTYFLQKMSILTKSFISGVEICLVLFITCIAISP